MPPVTAGGGDAVDNLLQTPEMRAELVANYEKNPASFTGSRLLAAAIAYASQGKLEEARSVYLKYLEKNTDNPRAYRGLGNIYLMTGNPEEAIGYYKIGWKLKDTSSLAALAAALLTLQRVEEFQALQPDLLANKSQNIEITNALIAYSVDDTKDKELFSKAIAGMKEEEILGREDTALYILKGFYTFGMTREAAQLEKRCQAKGYDIAKAKQP